MTPWRLSPAAQADLNEIWDYTERRWDTDQAARYILDIRDACEALARGRQRGRSAERIRTGYRQLPVGSHILFYRVGEAGAIEVIRILHKRMDVSAQLRG